MRRLATSWHNLSEEVPLVLIIVSRMHEMRNCEDEKSRGHFHNLVHATFYET